MVLYRKYRPQKFSDIFGQESVVKTLLSQLENGNISHGYLFCGPRGTGKTSSARIFTKAVNCLLYNQEKSNKNQKFGEPCNKCVSCISIANGSNLDLIEIDAASNRNIDDIRDLKEKIKLSPVFSKFKVYIIDEVHMLTKEAFNALLKTLEEPPGHAIFILCTTEVNKLPQTIISRVQRFNFTRASQSELTEVILNIAKAENIKITKEAIGAISKSSDGSFRDAVSILDQLSNKSAEITVSDVLNVATFTDWDFVFAFVEALIKKDAVFCVLKIEKLANEGADINFFAKEVILFLEKLLFIKLGVVDEEIDKVQLEKINSIVSEVKLSELQILMKIFLIGESEIKLYPLAQIPLVLAVCKYCVSDDDIENSNTSNSTDQVEIVTEQIEKPKAKKLNETGPETLPLKAVVKQKANKSPKLDLIADSWKEFLNQVRSYNAHVMAILRSTYPVEVKGDILVLEVFYRFHKEKLEETKINMKLEEILSNIIKSKVNMKFVLSDKKSNVPKAVSASNVVDANMEQISAEIADIFSK